MSQPDPGYRVLARKYRPQSFDDLLGHDAMVRTLRNAFASGRIAHAFILTGVRGVGKTTTARIMARALNYETEEIDRPTVDMTQEGRHCRAIAESRHPDVIEMDAASRTGVGDIRELIEGVRYAPIEGRYKVYIIDEVHMLSNSAFNALLKTLEEPPPHVKFIFATTEIRKVPVTVLSRCQRFDLRRFDPETLTDHLAAIAEKEDAAIARQALFLIAQAAEGSVRDALSLLDQALLRNPGGSVEAADVRDMLGLVDRTLTWDLLTAAMKGDPKTALTLFRDQYDGGADPGAILRDLMSLTHLLTRTKAAGDEAAHHGEAGEADAERAVTLARDVPLPALTRVWSLLTKALEEALSAPDPAAAAEIGLIRIAYAALQPSPDDILKALEREGADSPAGERQATASGSGGSDGGTTASTEPPAPPALRVAASGGRPAESPPAEVAATDTDGAPAPRITGLADVAELALQNRDMRLKEEVERDLVPVGLKPGRIEVAVRPGARQGLAGELGARLRDWTGESWFVAVVADPGGIPTLREDRDTRLRAHPLVKAALEAFPDAEITAVRPLTDDGNHTPDREDV